MRALAAVIAGATGLAGVFAVCLHGHADDGAPTPLTATGAATQPAKTPESLRERGEMILKALQAEPPDADLLRLVLTDIGNVQVSFRSKPLHRWVEGATVVNGQIVMAPVVGLNRVSGGRPPEEWIERLLAPAREGHAPAELKLAFAAPEEARTRRDRLLAQADEQIRSGMAGLVEKFPQLARTNWGSIVEALEAPSPAGRIIIWAGHYQGDTTGLRTPVPRQDSYNVLVILRPLQWPEPPGQWKLSPLYSTLALMGQVHASAGDPYLDAALKKLVADALAPLEILDDEVSGRRPPAATAPAPGSRPEPAVVTPYATLPGRPATSPAE